MKNRGVKIMATWRIEHSKLIRALQNKGSTIITTQTWNTGNYTVMTRKGTDWKYYVSSAGVIRTGQTIEGSVLCTDTFRESLLEDAKCPIK